MSQFRIVKYSTMWSTTSLTREVEEVLEQKEKEGWSIVSVAFGTNLWYMPTAFITLKK